MPGGMLVPVLACAAITWIAVQTITLREAVAERKVLTDQFLDRYETFFLPISTP